MAENLSVICVDAKRKEVLDDFKNAGQTYARSTHIRF